MEHTRNILLEIFYIPIWVLKALTSIDLVQRRNVPFYREHSCGISYCS